MSTSQDLQLHNLGKEVITLMKNRNKTIFTAESCTAGLVAHTISQHSGASEILLGGVISYHNQIKQSLLHVKETTIEQFGAVSFECVEEMVRGALSLSKADYALAITGIAGPTGGSELKPVGTVFTAIFNTQGGWAQHFLFEGSREEIQKAGTEAILRLLIATEQEQDFWDHRMKNAKELSPISLN